MYLTEAPFSDLTKPIHPHEGAADVVEHVDQVFYGDPKTAAMKVLGMA